jgi:hypothetical protein
LPFLFLIPFLHIKLPDFSVVIELGTIKIYLYEKGTLY